MNLKETSDAHFPQVGVIHKGLHETSITHLKLFNGSVKQHPFYLVKKRSVPYLSVTTSYVVTT